MESEFDGMHDPVRCTRCGAPRDRAIAPTCLVCGAYTYAAVLVEPDEPCAPTAGT